MAFPSITEQESAIISSFLAIFSWANILFILWYLAARVTACGLDKKDTWKLMGGGQKFCGTSIPQFLVYYFSMAIIVSISGLFLTPMTFILLSPVYPNKVVNTGIPTCLTGYTICFLTAAVLQFLFDEGTSTDESYEDIHNLHTNAYFLISSILIRILILGGFIKFVYLSGRKTVSMNQGNFSLHMILLFIAQSPIIFVGQESGRVIPAFKSGCYLDFGVLMSDLILLLGVHVLTMPTVEMSIFLPITTWTTNVITFIGNNALASIYGQIYNQNKYIYHIMALQCGGLFFYVYAMTIEVRAKKFSLEMTSPCPGPSTYIVWMAERSTNHCKICPAESPTNTSAAIEVTRPNTVTRAKDFAFDQV